jgi:hypothetical protein
MRALPNTALKNEQHLSLEARIKPVAQPNFL